MTISKNFAQDATPEEADLMAIVQKPFNQSNFVAKSGLPAWKQLPTWYLIKLGLAPSTKIRQRLSNLM
jgi:hypothetical protein